MTATGTWPEREELTVAISAAGAVGKQSVLAGGENSLQHVDDDLVVDVCGRGRAIVVIERRVELDHRG